MVSHDDMSRSFGAAADLYQAGRPEYPVEAVAWMLAPVGTKARVIDVGAGTGKLTRAVLAVGAEGVTAVDPDPLMLARLHAELPDVPVLEGTAEHLPLTDDSADAVVLGQAWHWVDPVAGSREIGRVLRAGGVLGLIWNIRDAGVGWVARMSDIMHNSNAEEMIASVGPQVAAPFNTLESRSWEWSRAMTRGDLLAMARSRSYLITAEPEERARIEAGLEALFDEIGAVGDATVDLPYVTTAFRAVS
ncbi:class I SAM-dependent methyltransferase [Microbacterium sp. ZW T5_56]|uniref:class I SAM-dependent methyltransferase n=1 Tax=Microbacterium sp. ZW T5_56 TaxID=3378081 RepID=UPI00385246DF